MDNIINGFSIGNLISVVSNPINLAYIATLILLEGLLSADNALVLAVMVKNLPENQKKKALFYGVFGAFFFRFIAIAMGTYLINIRWIKILGALYLLWLAFKHFFLKGSDDAEVKESSYSFWRVVVAVELMDIAFSVDSILAALGVSNQVWVLYIGGILGILMMRGVAKMFIELIERFPELESTAYVLISIIGVKMFLETFHIHINQVAFFSLMLVVFFATFPLSRFKKSRQRKRVFER